MSCMSRSYRSLSPLRPNFLPAPAGAGRRRSRPAIPAAPPQPRPAVRAAQLHWNRSARAACARSCPHPVHRLRAAARLEFAARLHRFAKPSDLPPEFVDTLPLQRARHQDLGRPARRTVLQHRQEPTPIVTARVALPGGSRSALLITIRSASSTMPFFIACRSSPALGNCNRTKASVIAATAVSDCPTPTVSTTITSNPAASQTSRHSRVRAATPPSVPALGEGRM